MTVLQSSLDTASPQFAANRAAVLAKLAELDAEHAKAVSGGGERYVRRHHERGKLLPRERIELLLDPDSPFPRAVPAGRVGHGLRGRRERRQRHRGDLRGRVRGHGQRPDGPRRRL